MASRRRIAVGYTKTRDLREQEPPPRPRGRKPGSENQPQRNDEIRRRHEAGESIAELARAFEMCYSRAWGIVNKGKKRGEKRS